MKSIKDWSLKHKIVLHVIVVGALTATILTFIYIKTQRNIIHTMSQQKADVIGALIENAIFSTMTEGRHEKVQSVLQQITSSIDIRKIRILNSHGKILRSSKTDEIESSIEGDSFSKLKDLLSNTNQSFTTFIRPNSTIQGFRLIENKGECVSCHNPQEKIIGILEVNIDYAETAILLRKKQIMGVVIALVALSILTFIILRLFNKLINRPIFQLKDKMKKVQEGDLSIQFPVSKNDEIGSLANNFNTMIKKLKEANQKIEELFNRQMEKAEHLASLGEIAAGLAHEIKNPIAGMKGALEIISQKTDSHDPNKEIFTEILIQIDKIDQIIQDLLRYAKPKEMSMTLVNPNECIENTIKLAKPQIKDKKIQFDFKGLKDGTLARIDADKIQEVMLNLMLNSISAINEKGYISIELSKKNNKELEIIFTDDGMGIKKDHLKQIFNPFYTTRARGTGLGLSICRKIIEAHKGSIEVNSKEKKGTTFFIRLPVLESES